MDAFGIREKLIAGYRSFTEGFVDIRDPRINDVELGDMGRQWPDPWLSLNPSFSSGGRIDELVRRGLLHPEYLTKRRILGAYRALRQGMDTGIPFQSTLNPQPGQGQRHPSKEISA